MFKADQEREGGRSQDGTQTSNEIQKGWKETKSMTWQRGGVEVKYLKPRRQEMISSLPPNTCVPLL